MKFIRNLYLTYRFFILLLLLVVVFATGFVFPVFFLIGQIAVASLLALVLLEIVILFVKKNPVQVKRTVSSQLSLGDENKVKLKIAHSYNFPVYLDIYDNLPFQFQIRDQHFEVLLGADEETSIAYEVRPTERGEYVFSDVFVYVAALTKLIQRKVVFPFTQGESHGTAYCNYA